MSLFVLTLAAAQPVAPTTLERHAAVKLATEAYRAASGFNGEVQLSFGPDDFLWSSYPGGPTNAQAHWLRSEQPWPWASITKQVAAVMVMQQVEDGKLELDAPVARYLPLPGASPAPTVRQLLQHRSGLRNPDDSAKDKAGLPSFYTDGATGLDWCLAEREPVPTEGWTYNNCDYLLLGRLLETVSGKSFGQLFLERIKRPANLARAGMIEGPSPFLVGYRADDPIRYERYGAAAGLAGRLQDVVAFSRALMDGKLLSATAIDALWKGDPKLGFMALGQWSFAVPLKGCAKPVRIVERRGAIQRYGLRNFIFPDQGIALAMATYQDGFDYGELWTGKGPAFDYLSAIVCGRAPD